MSPKRGPNPETIITNQIREVLSLMRVPNFKHHSDAFSEAGIPDLICTIPGLGKSLYIEVKSAKGKPTDDQEAFLAKMRQAGAIAFVAWSVADVVRKLSRIGYEPAQRISLQFTGQDLSGLKKSSTKPIKLDEGPMFGLQDP